MPDKDKPCPFCGSEDLSVNTWSLDDGEVEARECNHCYAGAPLDVWNGERVEAQGDE